MIYVYWMSLALLFYTYMGYPFLVWLRARLFPRAVRQGPIQASITVVVAAHNEAQRLPAKLQNLVENGFGRQGKEIVIVDDGSTDGTGSSISSYLGPWIRLLRQDDRLGKAVALNLGITAARGDIILFTDARQWIEPGAVEILTSYLADERVGAVSGELRIGRPGDAAIDSGEGVKMALENKIRLWESRFGSMIGVTGAFYAARKALVPEIPPGTILDDMYVPLRIVHQGYRVVLAPSAYAWDDLVAAPAQEFRRKVRTLTGNYQLMQRLPWLLNPFQRVFFDFFGHKISRLLSPFALAAVLIVPLWVPGVLFRSVLALEWTMLLLALGCLTFPRATKHLRLFHAGATLLVLNAAAGMAFVNFMLQREKVWAKS
ncbi:MAG: glycosyltransferase family 2 protein [Acidobacteriales bacterium]|nr:glycosyltransferase family 2 protein [Terriglobales bacterium]